MSVSSTVKEQILRLSQKLPASPQIFTRLGSLLNDVNADLGKIVNLISIDSGLTARVLRMSNSVYFRGGLPVQSLDEAINRVGFREVHKMVGVVMTEQLFKDGLPAYRFDAKQIWENSVATALAAERIAQEARLDEQAAYTVGLLRQTGKVVLNRILLAEQPGAVCPDDIDVLTWERARLSITNNEATAYILESWKLPRETCLAVRYHSEPEQASDGATLSACLHLAGWVVSALGKGMPCENLLWAVNADRLDQCGVTDDFVQDCVSETAAELDALKLQLSRS